jgi:hypothetical protein
MTVDANRVAIVQQPFRYTEAKDAAILARNPDALIVRLDTNLTYEAAVIRATDELEANKGARVFELKVHALIHFDDFVGGPPSFSFTSEQDKCFNRVMRVVGCACDTNTLTTTLRLRG